jgi:hypothetical protein
MALRTRSGGGDKVVGEEAAGTVLIDVSADASAEKKPPRGKMNGRRWTPEEDALVNRLVHRYGAMWKKISEMMTGMGNVRGKGEVRNRYLRRANSQRRQNIKYQPGSVAEHTAKRWNKCKTCGQPRAGHSCGLVLQVPGARGPPNQAF